MATSHALSHRWRRRLAVVAAASTLAVPLAPSGTPAAFADPGTTIDRLILTPTDAPATSQYVTWRSTSAADASVEYRLPGGTATIVAATPQDTIGSSTHFMTQLTGLTPSTTYEYRAGRAGDWTDWRTFTTAATTAEPFEFIYFGDAQNLLPTTWLQVANEAAAKAPDAVLSLHAGDLIDWADNQTEWRDWFASLGELGRTRQVIATPGNHEFFNDNQLRNWQANFNFSDNSPTIDTIGDLADRAEGSSQAAQRHAALFAHFTQRAANTVYHVDYQGVRFISLDSEQLSAYLTPASLPPCSGAGCPNTTSLWFEFQAAWLDHILTANPNQWTVVTFHRPVHSVSSGRNEPNVRNAFRPVIQQHNVDLVLNGHDHTYARGHLDADATETPGLTTGPVYAVANSGGKYYTLASATNNVWTQNGATQVKRGANVSTYQVISIDGGTLRYESYVGARNGNPPEQVGDLYDAFTITRNELGKFVTEDGVPIPGEDEGEVDTDQHLRVTVPQGPELGELVWAIDGTNDLVDLGTAEQSGDRFVASGAINPLRVTDTRHGAPAWAIAGQVSDFVADGETIEATYLGWSPKVTDNHGGAIAGAPVASTLLGGSGLAESATLASAVVGHALGSSLVAAGLELQAPIDLEPGAYTALLTLTALS